MSNNMSLNSVQPVGDMATRRSLAAPHPVMAFWHTMVGKKVVMAVTGVVLVGFVIAHMLGNLKIFSGPDEINAYSRFLREVGEAALAYGQLLWVVRIVLLLCVALHITAAAQLSRISWAARPVGYKVKRNLETTFAGYVMRWGGVLLVAFVIFHLLHLTAGAVGFHAGQFIGIEPNEKRIKEHLDNSLMLVTALNPHIGYEKAAKISLTAYHEDLSLREAALKLDFLTAEQFDAWVRPDEMTHPLAGQL